MKRNYKPRDPLVTKEQFVEALESSSTTYEVAEKLHICRMTVFRYLKRWGLKIVK